MAVIKNENYHDEQIKQNILKLRAVLDTLPPFCKIFFRGIEEYTSARTRLAYAYDIRLFFEFLHERNKECAKMEIVDGMTNDGTLVINGDNDMLKTVKNTKQKLIKFGFKDANDVTAYNIRVSDNATEFMVKEDEKE